MLRPRWRRLRRTGWRGTTGLGIRGRCTAHSFGAPNFGAPFGGLLVFFARGSACSGKPRGTGHSIASEGYSQSFFEKRLKRGGVGHPLGCLAAVSVTGKHEDLLPGDFFDFFGCFRFIVLEGKEREGKEPEGTGRKRGKGKEKETRKEGRKEHHDVVRNSCRTHMYFFQPDMHVPLSPSSHPPRPTPPF